LTLGTPIALSVPNEDQRPKDYTSMDEIPRPSHADYTYLIKYGIKASSGGGRSSARETIGKSTRAFFALIRRRWYPFTYCVPIEFN
jgi:chorismate synthase